MSLPAVVIACLSDSYAEGIARSATPAACDLAFGMAVGFNTALQLTETIDKARNVALHQRFESAYRQRQRALAEEVNA